MKTGRETDKRTDGRVTRGCSAFFNLHLCKCAKYVKIAKFKNLFPHALQLIMFLTLSLAFGVERQLLLDKYGYGAYPSLPVFLTVSFYKTVMK